MSIDVRLPPAGKMTDAILARWHVNAGQRVRVGEPLCEVETNKAVADLFVPADGTIAALLATAGQRVAVDEVIAVIAGADEDVDAIRASATARGTSSHPRKPAERSTVRRNFISRLLGLRS